MLEGIEGELKEINIEEENYVVFEEGIQKDVVIKRLIGGVGKLLGKEIGDEEMKLLGNVK